MRPTVIRLIAGGALGMAFSISLTLPGSVVFPAEPPARHLAAPEAPTPRVVHAAPVVRHPGKAHPRVVVQRVYAPAATVRETSVVRRTPPWSRPPRKPVHRSPAPVAEPVTPLAAPPAAPVAEPADEPKHADKHGDVKPRKPEKPKKHGSGKEHKPHGAHKKDREDHSDDRRGHDKGEHGGGRSDRG